MTNESDDRDHQADGYEEEEDDGDGDDVLFSWEALQAYAREEYEIDVEEDGWFATTVEWADTDRTQQVLVSFFERDDEDPWIVFRSTVCRKDQLAPEEALRHNDDLAVATLALTDDDTYELVYSFPLEALTAALFDDLLDQVAASADDLEEATTSADDY